MVELIVATVVSVYVERLRECVVNQVSGAYGVAIIRSNPGVTRSIIVSRAGAGRRARRRAGRRAGRSAFVGGSTSVPLRPSIFGFGFLRFLIKA